MGLWSLKGERSTGWPLILGWAALVGGSSLLTLTVYGLWVQLM